MYVLVEKHLASLMSMDDVIDAVENGFKDYMLGKYVLPLRGSAPVKESVSFNFMPVYTDYKETMAVKMLSLSGKGVWVIMALLQGQSEVNAQGKEERPTAIMSGRWITVMRTGAVSGVAAKYLARENAKIVGVFGAGKQARTQLEAVACLRDLEEARVYHPNPSSNSTFIKDMSKKRGIKVVRAEKPEDAVKGCDIILTATNSNTPVFKGEWLELGTFISAIGAHHGPAGRSWTQ